MRRLFVVVALLCVMLLMRTFVTQVDAPANVITLAAIGFVVLATFAVADMGTRLSLPRVTGFIVTGVALGPFAANILSVGVVQEMRMFNTLALGLIATTAGLELDLKALLPLFRTLGSTTFMKVVLGVPLVGLTLYGMSFVVDLGVFTFEQRTALAVVIGVLSIGTSPSISLAILSETKAKGRLADLVLGAAVFKDLVVVVCLAIGLAVASTLLNPTAAVTSDALFHVTRELVGSIVAGGLLGFVLIAYIRFIRAEMLLFVAAMILVVAELCRVFHLEVLLVFIFSGFVVRNFSHFEHELMKPLELVALPIFVVFFTIAGAGIDIAKTWAVLPAALAVCVVRAAVYWVSARFGNAVGQESPLIRKNAWSAYLPQAGVTLGLVGLAAQKLPELSSQVLTAGMAIVSLNLLVGPVTLRSALARAGEIPDANPKTVAPAPASGELPAHSAVPSLPIAHTLSPELSRFVDELKTFTVDSLRSLQAALEPPPNTFDLNVEPSQEQCLTIVRSYRATAEKWYDSWTEHLSELPTSIDRRRSADDMVARPSDGRFVRLKLGWHGFWARAFGRQALEHVPVRLCARVSVELTIARIAAHAFERALERHFASERRSDAELPELWINDIDNAMIAFAQLLEDAGGPRMAAKALRFSEVEPAIRTELGQLDEKREEQFALRTAALWGSVVAQHKIAELQASMAEVLEVHVFAPANEVASRAQTAVSRLIDQVSDLARSTEPGGVSPQPALSALADARQTLAEALGRGLRVSVVMRELGTAMRAALEKLPTDLRCYQQPAPNERYGGVIRRIDLREAAETHLVKRLVPLFDQSMQSLSNTFVHLPRDVHAVLQPLVEQLQPSSDGPKSWSAVHQTRVATTKLNGLVQALQEQVARETNQQRSAFLAAITSLERELSTTQALSETTTHRLRQLVSSLSGIFRPLLERQHSGAYATVSDARRIATALQQARGATVPATARSWFSQEPVRDGRIFSDQSNTIYRILEEESRWRNGERAAVLVRAETGSGKTSLLNMCELELRGPQVIHLNAEGSEQARLLTDALALLLGCAATERSIIRALERQKPTLLVDNLPVWLARSVDPLHELNRLLLLIARARGAFWLVSLDPSTQGRYSPFVNVEAAFTTVVDIPQATLEDLQVMVASRSARAKRELSYKHTSVGRLLGRLGLRGDKWLYYLLLRRHSRGNPGRALALVLRSAQGGNDTLELDPAALRAVEHSLPSELTTSQLAALLCLVEFGACTLPNMARLVGTDEEHMELELTFLQSAGVVRRNNTGAFALEDAARWPVIDELERLGALKLRGRKAPATVRSRARTWWLIGVIAACLSAIYVLARGALASPYVNFVFIVGTLAALIAVAVKTRLFRHRFDPSDPATGRLVAVRLEHPSPRDVKEFVTRAAHICPYRVPWTPVTVGLEGQELRIEIDTWHPRDLGEVEAYLSARLDAYQKREARIDSTLPGLG